MFSASRGRLAVSCPGTMIRLEKFHQAAPRCPRSRARSPGGSRAAREPVVERELIGSATFVRLESDADDYIGAGQTYGYTQANAVITVTARAGNLSIAIRGDEGWSGSFQAPGALSRLQPGSYDGLQRYPFHDPASGGLNWSGEGRGCNTLSGRFTVDSLTYINGDLTTIDLRFEQHCEGEAPALRGAIHSGGGRAAVRRRKRARRAGQPRPLGGAHG